MRSAALLADCVILAVAGDERIVGFDAALRNAGHPGARVLDYRDFLADPASLRRLFPRESGVLRVDSPGGGAELRHALTRFGAMSGAAEIDGPALHEVIVASTQIRPGYHLQRGFDAAVRRASAVVPLDVISMNDPEAIALFYDKRACHAFMAAHGFPVPRALRPARGFDQLRQAMAEAGFARVFVKPRFGSGAAGIAALALSPSGFVATSSARLSRDDVGVILHHSSHLRRYEGAEAAMLVEALLRQDAHVEQWAPKAAIDGRPCDLRVLVVGGEVAHAVARVGAGPITNLDLGARRADAGALRAKVSPAAWEAMLVDCRRFARLFPRAFHLAFDVAFLASRRRHVFFEVNAFGDLLRRVRHEGLDPYELQVARFPAWAAARAEAELAA